MCERGDSNPYGRSHWILSPARLPVPPLSQGVHQRRNIWNTDLQYKCFGSVCRFGLSINVFWLKWRSNRYRLPAIWTIAIFQIPGCRSEGWICRRCRASEVNFRPSGYEPFRLSRRQESAETQESQNMVNCRLTTGCTRTKHTLLLGTHSAGSLESKIRRLSDKGLQSCESVHGQSPRILRCKEGRRRKQYGRI
jgi:hypothetical protein